MKLLRLVRTALLRDVFRRILISAELIVGIVFLFLCISILMKNREIDRYMELHGDMAAIDPNNSEQRIYAEEHGVLFEPTVRLQAEQAAGGKTWYAEINSLDFYKAVPLKLSSGSWFSDEDRGCTYNAVVPYSLRKHFSPGKSYEMDFIEYGSVSVYVCGILDTDITFGNSYAGGFDDSNCRMLLCMAKGAEKPDASGFFAHSYVKLRDVEPEKLRALDIDAVCLIKDAFRQGNRKTAALPTFLALILTVLFGTALLGDHFLTARENEKTFAVYFICGASTGKAVLLQSAVNFAETLLPYLISLAAALIIPIRLYPFSAIGILLILLAGSALLSLVQMIRLRRESPSQIIARRFRG